MSRQVCIRKWQPAIAAFGNFRFGEFSALPRPRRFCGDIKAAEFPHPPLVSLRSYQSGNPAAQIQPSAQVLRYLQRSRQMGMSCAAARPSPPSPQVKQYSVRKSSPICPALPPHQRCQGRDRDSRSHNIKYHMIRDAVMPIFDVMSW